MARINRSSLKTIVKECLVEILQEGLSNPRASGRQQMSESTSRNSTSLHSKKQQKSQQRRRTSLDYIQYASEENNKKDLDSRIESSVTSMTSDPVLSSILSDTAKTTLQEQFSAERKGPAGSAMPTAINGDAAARQAAVSTPEDLFGSDVSSKWADLAFASSKKPGQ